MITILATLQKQINNFVLNHMGEIKTYNSSKNGHVLHNENSIGKNLMNAFFNSQFHIEFTNIMVKLNKKKIL
jgi:hypothetical protein